MARAASGATSVETLAALADSNERHENERAKMKALATVCG